MERNWGNEPGGGEETGQCNQKCGDWGSTSGHAKESASHTAQYLSSDAIGQRRKRNWKHLGLFSWWFFFFN